MALKQEYLEKIKPQLAKDLKIKNTHAVPALQKVVINVGVGEAANDKKVIERVVADVTAISGQKPMICLARKSVAAFKIRKGLAIGVKVTLRGVRAYSFLEKLIKIVLPRIRDFKGLTIKSFDGRGNLSIGISDQTLFPEIEYDKIDKIRGLEITIVTSARNNEEAKAFFSSLGIPFVEDLQKEVR